ncbi:MAG TPA: hypothetical protein VGB85_20030 [Nannocystis sp.]|jgi:Na+-translocating ferredoxin:NAD+ oxidoreductase RnfC subunit
MAPRPPESREQFIRRLRAAGDSVAGQPLGFGGHHFTHAVVVEGGRWSVRRLILDQAKVDAYRAEHRVFMPEHAEMLSEPGPEEVLGADSLAGLVAAIEAGEWPLD